MITIKPNCRISVDFPPILGPVTKTKDGCSMPSSVQPMIVRFGMKTSSELAHGYTPSIRLTNG